MVTTRVRNYALVRWLPRGFTRGCCLTPPFSVSQGQLLGASVPQCSGSVLPRYDMSFIPNKIWGAVNSAVPLGMNSVHNWPLAQLLALEPRVRVGTDHGIT